MQNGLIRRIAVCAVLLIAIAFFKSVQIQVARADTIAPAESVLNPALFVAALLNGTGDVQSSFARGTTVEISFVLESLGGGGSVVWAITVQQDSVVYNIVDVPCAISTIPMIVTYSQLLPVDYPVGTWIATVQVYASNGVTPLAVTTLIFTVS